MKVKLPERRAVSGPGRQDGGAPAAAPLKTRGGKTARRVLRRIGSVSYTHLTLPTTERV